MWRAFEYSTGDYLSASDRSRSGWIVEHSSSPPPPILPGARGGRYVSAIRLLLDRHDFVKIRGGAPKDEYEPEADRIMRDLDRRTSGGHARTLAQPTVTSAR